MSTITLPLSIESHVTQLTWRSESQVYRSTSPVSGAVQTVGRLGHKWQVQLQLRQARHADRAPVEAFIAALEGGANRLALWHLIRPVPRGTMRGSPTLSASAIAGARSVSISGGGTLLAGDMIGINGQLLMVTADVTLPGAVSFVGPLRQAASSGTSVVWDKPTALFTLTDGPSAVYEAVVSGAIGLTLAEVYA